MPLPVLFGTNKIAALAGTSIAAFKYAKKSLLIISYFSLSHSNCFISSHLGAQIINHIDSNLLKPLILVILIVIAIYTFIKKDLGSIETKELSLNKQMLYGACIGLIVGFYDGFFGPGTGSFFCIRLCCGFRF